MIRALAALDAGSGWPDGDAATAIAASRHALCSEGEVLTILAEARALGCVDDTVAALTPAARALLDGVAALADACTGGASSFVVQADHSVIAPPDLDSDLAARLHAVADLESSAGASVLRISDASIASALANGWVAEDVLAFLHTHSSVDIPQNVERTIHDAAARHGRLRSGTAATWLHSDDPALLARAVGVKATKLVLVCPTVAVSALPEAKVRELLAAKKVLVASETAGAGDAARGERDPRLVTRDVVALRPDPVAALDALAARAAKLPQRVKDDALSPHEQHRAALQARTRAGQYRGGDEEDGSGGEGPGERMLRLVLGGFDAPDEEFPGFDELDDPDLDW